MSTFLSILYIDADVPLHEKCLDHSVCRFLSLLALISTALSMGMGFPWKMSHGMGWDGTARIAFSMNDNE